jgi:hypothetical protein
MNFIILGIIQIVIQGLYIGMRKFGNLNPKKRDKFKLDLMSVAN